MKITDEAVLKELKRVRSYELEERIEDYPEDEREGRSDWQVLSDEAGYLYDNYMEDGHRFHDDLNDCRRLLRETRYGKRIPLDIRTLKPKYGYWPNDIQSAKDTVNEVNRIKNLLKRLQEKDIWSCWYVV